MALVRLLKRVGFVLTSGAVIAWLSQAQADEPAGPCGNVISILNEGKAYEAFDKKNGGGDKRLRFRLDGKELDSKQLCAADRCKTESKPDAKTGANVETNPKAKPADDVETKPAGRVEAKAEIKVGTKAEIKVATKVEIVAAAAAAEKVIATIDLAGRTASYCVNGLSRVDATPSQRRNGCPPSYLVNFLAVKLVDGDGPFARRDVTIQYLYRQDSGPGNLEHCTAPAILDGMFRRRAWTVGLDHGATAFIGETDFPRDRRAPVPQDPPFAISVSGGD